MGLAFAPPVAFRGTQLGFRYRRSVTTAPVRMSAESSAQADASLSLFSIPVSNYSMRARYIAARKGLSEDDFTVKAPADIGGLKSDQYMALNPLGKMPLLEIERSSAGIPSPPLFESRVICEYLIDRFRNTEPSFIPSASPESRAVSNLVATIMDTYIGPLHPAMYKSQPENADRAAQVEQMLKYFDVIESVIDADGPYVAGADISYGDVALFGKYARPYMRLNARVRRRFRRTGDRRLTHVSCCLM